jgi:SRSO17 transposase
MGLQDRDEAEARFTAYVDGLASVLGHADRVGPFHDYVVGLMLPGDRKSVEPMAARTAPARPTNLTRPQRVKITVPRY